MNCLATHYSACPLELGQTLLQRRRAQPGYPVLPITWQLREPRLRWHRLYPRQRETAKQFCPESSQFQRGEIAPA